MKVLKSWGSAGEVVLSLEGEDARDLESQEPVFIDFDELPVPFFIEKMQAKGNRLIVKFEDVDTLSAAEELVGREVRREREEAEDEDSVIGMLVRDARTRRTVGTIVDFSDYGGNTLITVDTQQGELLLPLHEDLIVNVHGDVITLDIPNGLLD
jgi:16S rRNA processing protein RimM